MGLNTAKMGEEMSPYGSCLLRIISQDEHEHILANNLKTPIEWGVELLDLIQDQDSVTATFLQDGKKTTQKFSYAIGCDGAP